MFLHVHNSMSYAMRNDMLRIVSQACALLGQAARLIFIPKYLLLDYDRHDECGNAQLVQLNNRIYFPKSLLIISARENKTHKAKEEEKRNRVWFQDSRNPFALLPPGFPFDIISR